MVIKDYSNYIFIDKISKEGDILDIASNWFPLTNEVEKEKIYEARKWIKKNLKKQEGYNEKLNSDLLYKIYQKDKNHQNFEKGVFIYALFQDNYLFKLIKDSNEKNVLCFNLSWKDKKLNKIIEDTVSFN